MSQETASRLTARELVRFLLVKKFEGLPGSGRLSPSSKLDTLQHWTLLNTEVRKIVEAVIGEISHSEETAELPDEEKVNRRLAAMNVMSKQGWTPRLELWIEAGTLMDTIMAVSVKDSVDGEVFQMFYVPEFGARPGAGGDKIAELLTNPRYKCTEGDRAMLSGRVRKKVRREKSHFRTTITTASGKNIILQVTRGVKVSQLKSKIQDVEGTSPGQQRLFADGVWLADTQCLGFYLDKGVDLDTIDLLLHMYGC